MAKELTKMEKIVSLCKRRGFIFPSSEIYGGFAGVYDYGPLGRELKNNVQESWRKEMVQLRENIVGLDSGIFTQAKVWEASGHTSAGFTDLLQECKKCHKRFRIDQISSQGKGAAKCPECGGQLTEPKKFNLLVKTHFGSPDDEAGLTYLRGETAQGIYVNFENVKDSMRMEIPFGIAQVGKAFRNEITFGHFIFRMREFEQMEQQFFINPKEADKWFDYWKKERMRWYLDIGIKKENLRFKEHEKDELAHYAKRAIDIEYKFPFGWKELEGIHNRGDWDLSRHSKFSGHDLSYYDEKTKEKYIPYIIETSAGLDRTVLVVLIDTHEEIKGGRTTTTKAVKDIEIVMRFHKSLAPIKAAVLPLVRKEKLIKVARDIFKDLQKYWMVQYDETGSIGRRYRRQDEIGTPHCLTIDFESLEDKKVTVRDRDSMKQDRIAIEGLAEYLKDKLDK